MRIANILVNNTGSYIKAVEHAGAGSIESNLFALDAGVRIADNSGAGIYNAAIDGILTLVLSHHVAGVDIQNECYAQGIKEAVEVVANEYDFDEV